MSETIGPKPSTVGYPELDIVAVFCLAVLPDIVNCFATHESLGNYDFTFIHISLITRSLQVVVPILLIMKLRNVSWADYGFKKFRPIADVAAGWGLCVAAYILVVVFYQLLLLSQFDLQTSRAAIEDVIDSSMPHTSTGILIIIASGLANGFAEELAIRCYLLTRIREATSSAFVAITLTTLLFAAYHGYQGVIGIANTLPIGIAYGIFMVRYRRFWPLAISHATFDIVAIWG